MKHKIISSSDFMKASIEGCCSPTRFFDECQNCGRVLCPPICKHPEAQKGRTKILDNKIAEAKKRIKEWKKEKSDLSPVDA